MMVRELVPKLRAFAHRREIRNILHPQAAVSALAAPTPRVAAKASPPPARESIGRTIASTPELVLIGVSTGGPAALARVLPLLPKDFPVPIVVVQHMPPIFTQSLAESLASKCNLRVREAADGEKIEPGLVLIAPGGQQMRLVPGLDTLARVQITDDPPENNCKPAVDYLFRSAANGLPGRAMAVILTGMGSDGTLGLRLLRRHGCFTIAQDEATSVVYGMPKAAVEAGVVDVVLPLDAIAAKIAAAAKVRGS